MGAFFVACAYQRVHMGTLVQGALADLLSGFVEAQSMHEKKDMVLRPDVWTAHKMTFTATVLRP